MNRRVESNLVRAIIDVLNANGCTAVRFNNQPTAQIVGPQRKFVGYRKLNNRRGISDITAVAPGGRAIWIEAKTETGRLSDEQRDFLDEVFALGAIAMVARSVEEVIAMVRWQKKRKWLGDHETFLLEHDLHW